MNGRILGATLGVLVTAGCGDTTGPLTESTLSLSVVVPTGAAAAMGEGPSLAVTQSDGQNTLVLQRVAMVLREVELKRAVAQGCDDSGPGSDDHCEEFQAGPMILELPLDGTTSRTVTIDVPPDTYDQLEFDIHKPDDDAPSDLAFLQANPGFVDTSVRVEGTWNGVPFVFLQDLNEEQELHLVPPMIIEEGSGPSNLTMVLDVATWFMTASGSLIDPNSANKGGANEGLVESNIRRSIDAFGDDDGDGRRD